MAADIEFVQLPVPAPAQDWLTEAQVLLALGNISSRTLDTYIQSGRFPFGVPFGREKKWPREDVAWFYLGKRLEARLKGRSPDEEAA